MNKSGNRDIELPKQAFDILLSLNREKYTNQRILSEKSGLSLGCVNKSLKLLEEYKLINKDCILTVKAKDLIGKRSPQKAVILAAGIGMRMVPINMITPKALLKVKGDVLIERQIRQLNEAGITDISVVVGFMKEAFEYLVDKFNINLISNDHYAAKNNLYSVSLASDRLANSYIIPCDIWSESNPFNRDELYSWYMISDGQDKNSSVRINRKNELVSIPSGDFGNRMIGIAYLLKEDAEKVSSNIERLLSDGRHDESFWEEALFGNDRMFINARSVSDNAVREINTFEQLREIDSGSDHLKMMP